MKEEGPPGVGAGLWSGITDSNRGQKLGRLLCYHYTNPACGALRRAVPEGQSGRGDRIRTCDPLVPNQVRYRPALLPVPITICIVNIVNRYKIQNKNLRAERKGFEPLVQFNPYGSLANY